MRWTRLTAATLLAGAAFTGFTHAARAEVRRTGEIQILGNVQTPTREILARVALYPGQRLPSAEQLRVMERRLYQAFRQKFTTSDRRPSIIVEHLPDGDEYHRIYIYFPEDLPGETTWFGW